MSPAKNPELILAAGCVCWHREITKRGRERIKVLLIKRTKQRDISFPKGKLDPGESMPQAAVRETWEETGLRVDLGINLGTVHYRLSGGREKTVQYWAAEIKDSQLKNWKFKANKEIAAVEWVPLEKAAKRLSYNADREILAVFTELAQRDVLDSFSIILLRHAKAEPRSELFKVDRRRPLADAGEDHAELLVPTLAAFGPRRIISSDAERCMRTVAPLAAHLKKTIRAHEDLSQDNWDTGDLRGLRRTVEKAVNKQKTAIICSHRPVLPDIARALVEATSSVPGSYIQKATDLPTGGFSVFHLSRKNPQAGIISIETYPLKP